MNSLRLIDVTMHELSAPQTLEMLVRLFRQSKTEPVTLMTLRGEGRDMISKVRTELSRSRKTYEEAGRLVPMFGFAVNRPLLIHQDGIAKEVYALTYRVTGLQNMKNLARQEFSL